MLYHAGIKITLRTSILDPQGKATAHAMEQLQFKGVHDVRIGKYVELQVEADSEAAAHAVAFEACEKLLANQVMEDFSIEVTAAEAA